MITISCKGITIGPTLTRAGQKLTLPMDLRMIEEILLILTACFQYSSAIEVDIGICDSNKMELVPTTRLQLLPVIETYKSWCGSDFCIKTRTAYTKKEVTLNQWMKRQTCCDGYKEIESGVRPLTCEPVCAENCVHASCSEPNVCKCLPGYVKETAYECSPVCVNGCVNGKCTGPNICTCNNGYESSALSHVCMPVCENNCTNGFCISPNKCQCFSHHELDKGSTHICVPKCDEKCINGLCTAPNICSCNTNFKLDKNNQTLCNPICELDCILGYCSNPNQCTCYSGYIKDSDSPSVCKPFCKKGCQEGTCIAPELCDCPSFYKQKEYTLDECIPDCPDECVNGNCTEPGRCTCLEGFIPDTIHPNICVQDMGISAMPSKAEIVKLMECDETNLTLGETGYRCLITANKDLHTKSKNNPNCIKINNITLKYCHDNCSSDIMCLLPIDGEEFVQRNHFNMLRTDNTSDEKNVTFDIKIIPAKGDEKGCYCCACSRNINCYGIQSIELSFCPDNKTGTDHKLNLLWWIIPIICLGVLIISFVAGFLFWKRRRRIDYALRYKEEQNCTNHKNATFERTRELISDDDDDESEVET